MVMEADSTRVSPQAQKRTRSPDLAPHCKRKKVQRTVFTQVQQEALEERFREQNFLSKEERKDFAEELKLSERQIMIWFQNRRGRLKRRGPQDQAYTPSKMDELSGARPHPILYGMLASLHYNKHRYQMDGALPIPYRPQLFPGLPYQDPRFVATEHAPPNVNAKDIAPRNDYSTPIPPQGSGNRYHPHNETTGNNNTNGVQDNRGHIPNGFAHTQTSREMNASTINHPIIATTNGNTGNYYGPTNRQVHNSSDIAKPEEHQYRQPHAQAQLPTAGGGSSYPQHSVGPLGNANVSSGLRPSTTINEYHNAGIAHRTVQQEHGALMTDAPQMVPQLVLHQDTDAGNSTAHHRGNNTEGVASDDLMMAQIDPIIQFGVPSSASEGAMQSSQIYTGAMLFKQITSTEDGSEFNGRTKSQFASDFPCVPVTDSQDASFPVFTNSCMYSTV